MSLTCHELISSVQSSVAGLFFFESRALANARYGEQIGMIEIPYAAKLLFQELMAMQIAPRLMTSLPVLPRSSMRPKTL